MALLRVGKVELVIGATLSTVVSASLEFVLTRCALVRRKTFVAQSLSVTQTALLGALTVVVLISVANGCVRALALLSVVVVLMNYISLAPRRPKVTPVASLLAIAQ